MNNIIASSENYKRRVDAAEASKELN